jgi:hypothetical protein
MTGELIPSPLLPVSPGTFPVPAIIHDAGEKASEHFLEFFAATIRNKNTRAAYVQAASQFFAWCEQYQLQLGSIRPLHVSAYIESKPLTCAFHQAAPGGTSRPLQLACDQASRSR